MAGHSSRLLDAAQQMALDEAIFLNAPAQEIVLRFYRWAELSVTFGYSQPSAVAWAAAQDRGIKTTPVRRATGGGIVFHDGDLTFSMVFPWERLCSPRLIYKNIHRGIHLGLKAMGIASALWSPPDRDRAAGNPLLKQCFFAPEPLDLVAPDGRKALGGALRRRSQRGLYQGSLRPEVLGAQVSEIERAIIHGIEMEWKRSVQRTIAAAWEKEALAREGKYRSDSWNKRI